MIYGECGDKEYDTETQFCDWEEKKAYDLCGGQRYNVNHFTSCKDGSIYYACGDGEYNMNTQFCEENKIYERCGEELEKYDVNLYFCIPHAGLYGYCGEKTYPVKSATVKCEKGKLLYICNGEYYDSETHFCRDNQVYALCGEKHKTYDPKTYFCIDGKVQAKCKDEYYDPLTHFCENDQIYALCGGLTYTPQNQKCVDNTIDYRTFCGDVEFDNRTHFCTTFDESNIITPLCGENLKSYFITTQVCKDGKVLEKCGEDGYDPKIQVCKGNKVLSKCGEYGYDPETQVCIEDHVLTKCGENSYDPATHFCGTNNQITLRCGEQLEDYDLETQKCEEGKVLTQCGETYYYPPEQKCVNNKAEDRYFCGEGDNKKEYDKTKQFCDTRDNHVYKFIHFYNEQSKKPYYPVYWITEDVTYYSNNVGYRLNWFTWETAQSACPKGWHLPTKKEFELLIYKAGGNDIAGKNLKSTSGWSKTTHVVTARGSHITVEDGKEALDTYGFNAKPSGYNFEGIEPSDGFGDNLGLWWSSTDEGDSVYVLEMHNNSDAATVKLWPKKSSMETDMNYSVRCIWVGRSTKDTP